MASGGGILLLLLAAPGGLGELLYRVRDRILRHVAARRGIIVPSLVADVADRARGRRPPASGSRRPPDVLLSIRALDVAYDGVQVLFGVDLEVGDGELLALLGTNGAGKSTILRAVSGLVAPAAGSITFAGRDLTGADAAEVVAAGIVTLPGGRGVFPSLTVAEHFRVGGFTRRRQPEALRASTERALDTFPILARALESTGGDAVRRRAADAQPVARPSSANRVCC